jgi:hypothetical protein
MGWELWRRLKLDEFFQGPTDTDGADVPWSSSPWRADGSFRHLLVRISRSDVLVDDWAMAPLTNRNVGTSGKSAKNVIKLGA